MAVCLWQLSHGVRSAWYEYHGFHGARTHPSRPSSAVAHGLRDVAFPGDAGASIRGGICLRGPALPWCWPAAPKRIGVRCGRTPSYIGVLETARDPRAKLLVLEGLFDNPWIQTKALYAPAGVLAQLGGMLSDYLAGLRPDAPRTSEYLPTLRVHSLVLVAGDADRTVSIAVSKALYDIAAEPKAFWVIRSGVHGGYLAADTTYGPRLRAIVERTLAAPAAAAAAH